MKPKPHHDQDPEHYIYKGAPLPSKPTYFWLWVIAIALVIFYVASFVVINLDISIHHP